MLDARLSDVNVGDAGVEGLRLSNDRAVWSSGCVSLFGNCCLAAHGVSHIAG